MVIALGSSKGRDIILFGILFVLLGGLCLYFVYSAGPEEFYKEVKNVYNIQREELLDYLYVDEYLPPETSGDWIAYAEFYITTYYFENGTFLGVEIIYNWTATEDVYFGISNIDEGEVLVTEYGKHGEGSVIVKYEGKNKYRIAWRQTLGREVYISGEICFYAVRGEWNKTRILDEEKIQNYKITEYFGWGLIAFGALLTIIGYILKRREF